MGGTNSSVEFSNIDANNDQDNNENGIKLSEMGIQLLIDVAEDGLFDNGNNIGFQFLQQATLDQSQEEQQLITGVSFVR